MYIYIHVHVLNVNSCIHCIHSFMNLDYPVLDYPDPRLSGYPVKSQNCANHRDFWSPAKLLRFF